MSISLVNAHRTSPFAPVEGVRQQSLFQRIYAAVANFFTTIAQMLRSCFAKPLRNVVNERIDLGPMSESLKAKMEPYKQMPAEIYGTEMETEGAVHMVNGEEFRDLPKCLPVVKQAPCLRLAIENARRVLQKDEARLNAFNEDLETCSNPSAVMEAVLRLYIFCPNPNPPKYLTKKVDQREVNFCSQLNELKRIFAGLSTDKKELIVDSFDRPSEELDLPKPGKRFIKDLRNYSHELSQGNPLFLSAIGQVID